MRETRAIFEPSTTAVLEPDSAQRVYQYASRSLSPRWGRTFFCVLTFPLSFSAEIFMFASRLRYRSGSHTHSYDHLALPCTQETAQQKRKMRTSRSRGQQSSQECRQALLILENRSRLSTVGQYLLAGGR